MKDGWREEGRKKNKEKKEERRKGRTERRKEKVCSKSMFIDDMIKKILENIQMSQILSHKDIRSIASQN